MCKSCSTKKTYTIKDLNEWAKQKEGECLSDKYIDSAYKYQWKCKLGHTWFANWNNVRNKNQWCNECASLKMSQDRLGFTIEDLQNFAKNKGGECLSTEYVGIKTKYTWKCKCGNIWDAKWGHVKQKSWCPECAKKQRAKNRIQNGNDNINTLKDFAKSKGGECLSTEYLGVEAKYLWKCEHQHEWYASWYSLKKLNTWCPSCNLTRYTIEDLQNFAKDKGGECLSTEYIGVKTKYTWKCNEGHTWNKTWDSMVNKNSWCPKCASFKYLNESRVRFILEKLLDASFNSNKELFPPYILDGYNHNLNLAFEYNGIQHYENVKHFHKSNNKDLKSQIKRDNTIIDLCKKNNINLLIVPYWEIQNKSNNKVINFLIKELSILSYEIKNNNIDFKKFYEKNSNLKEMHKHAKSKGGECLSTEYVGNNAKYTWKCKCGYKWDARWSHIKSRNQWCPKCAKKIKPTIKTLQEFAKSKGGECLSTEYVDRNTEYRWRCNCGNEWNATWSYITTRAWCNHNLDLKTLQNFAKDKGGECLSTEYIGVKTKYTWKCKCGNVWDSTWACVQKKQNWCSKCTKEKQSINMIKTLQEFAKNKGGECLSTEYINAKTKYTWKCKCGNVWDASWANINNKNSWCPSCANKKTTIW